MPEHGTRASFQAGCHCNACRSANAAYAAVHRLGESGLIEAGETRAHCFKLRAQGMGYRQIAKVAGVERESVLRLLTSPSPLMMQRGISRRLLAVTPKPALGIRVMARETGRMVYLLGLDLYARPEIAKLTGLARNTVEYLCAGKPVPREGKKPKRRLGRRFCALRTALKIGRLYRSTQPTDENKC